MERTISIGRASSNDLVVNSLNVSKNHASLVIKENGKLVLVDNNSSNGIWINNRRVKSAAIALEDKIQIADQIVDLAKHFEIKDGVLLNVKEANDFTASFIDIKRIDKEFETTLDEISKSSGRQMMMFRLSIVVIPLFGFVITILNSILSEESKLVFSKILPFLSIFMILIGIGSLYFYKKAIQSSSEKEKKRKRARDDYKLTYTCPNCKNFIPDSAYIIEQRKKYNCRYCKALLFENK